ncbi:thiamine pyrophosphate protein TPP binding domain-containing protein [Clostridium sp. CAG:306]|nr:thiamine pyrophosphate protein TPP binding domain-containing protein [Clostridium sp. CAG:306]
MPRVADYVMQRLQKQGVKHIFLVTGRGMLYLSDALARQEGIQGICVHHEQAAAYAAMSYAQKTNNIGVAMVSTGCASTNAITGVLCAWQDNLPCVFISGQNKLNETTRYTNLPIRTYGQQEADIVSLVKPITKYATMITKPEDIAYEMDKALFLANEGRKGPVWIDIPLDIQNMRIEEEKLKCFIPDICVKKPTPKDIKTVIEKINNARRPIILFGSGIRSAQAQKELKTFISKTKIPAVYSTSSVDILDTNSELVIGCVGAMAANRAANFAIQNADLILILGNRLTTMITGNDINKFAREAEIIAVDIDEFEHKKFPKKIDKFIHSDIKEFLKEINKETAKETEIKWQEKCKHWKTEFPKCELQYKNTKAVDLYELAEVLSENMDDDAVCITDAGLEELIVPTTIQFKEEQRCIHPVSQGAMGFALPALIGSYFADKKQNIAVIGDGSIMMNLQELQTISYHKIPVKILIINNNCYAVIRKRQQDLFRTRTIGTDSENGVSCPDFQHVAKCFDFKYEKISSTDELYKLKNILKLDEPVICEIIGKENQGYIHSSFRKNSKGKFVQPPIEDQSPFIDRALFNREMVVEPIDE